MKVLVSGGSSPTCKELVLLRPEWDWVLIVRSPPEWLVGKNENISVIECDFDSSKGFSGFSGDLRALKNVDAFVHLAGGVLDHGDFLSLKLSEWKRCFDVNFFSAVSILDSVLRGKSDRLLNVLLVSSYAALQPGKLNPHYSSSKAALNCLARYIAANFAKDGVICNAVCPAKLDNEILWRDARDALERRNIAGSSADEFFKKFRDTALQKRALDRLPTSKDFAGFLISILELGDIHFTGQVIAYDGCSL